MNGAGLNGREDVIVLRRPNPAQQWLQERLQVYSATKAKVAFLLLLLGGLFGGPALLYQGLAGFMANSAGTSGGGAGALAFNQLLLAWLSLIALVLLSKIIEPLRFPARLVLAERSIKLVWDCGIPWRTEELPWTSLISLSTVKDLKRFARPSTHVLLVAENGKTLRFDLSFLPIAERGRLLASLERHCDGASLSPELVLALMPLPERCFTELWLAELKESPVHFE